jgi:hypothetical protein
MFGRGRTVHIGLEATSPEAFDTIRARLLEREATGGFATDFGVALSLFFRDPDSLERQVCLHNPAATPVHLKPPGTPAAGMTRHAEARVRRARDFLGTHRRLRHK